MKISILRIGLNISAWLLVVVLSLGFGELILRNFFPLHLTGGYIGDYQYDEELGYRLKAGYFTNTTDYKQEAYTNKLGSINFTDGFNNYRKRIFAMGDSYTQGTGLPIDMSYPAQLDLLLNMRDEKYIKDIAVVNLGLAAFGGDQYRIVYKRFMQEVGAPQGILYFGCSNDQEDDDLFRNGQRHRALVEGNPRFGLFLKSLAWAAQGTEIGKRINYVRRSFARKSITTAGIDGNYPQRPVAEQQKEHLEWFLSQAKKISAVLVVGWTNSPDDPADPNSYQWLKDWASRNQVPFADWYPAVRSVKQQLPVLSITNDHSGGHYRGWVNGLIARSFAEKLGEVGLARIH